MPLPKEDLATIEEIQMEAMYRLIEAILLGVLDNVSITGKWKNRDISMTTLMKKKEKLLEMKDYLETEGWRIWLGIYCEYFHRSQLKIDRNFKKICRKSLYHVNKRIREKINNK